MGLHKRHTHGRVFRGEEAREQMRVHKRDSHRNTPIMNVPEGFPQKEGGETVQTAEQVVYVTLSQTFSGPAIYSTMSSDPNATPVSAAAAAPTSNNNDDVQSSYAAMKSSAQAGNQATTAPTSVATVTPQSSNSAAAAATTMATASVSASAASSFAHNAVGGTPVQATHSATASPSQSISQEGSGLSAGGKAGLAIGILLAIALAGGLIFFCYRRKKNSAAHEESMNEKHGSFADAGARRIEAGGKRDSSMTEKVPASLRSTRTASTAPRLSLRPVTQFLPNLTENRKSSANALDAAAAGGEKRSAWERPSQQQNPFDDATMLSEKQARPESPPSNPFEEPEGKPSVDSTNAPAKRSSKGSWEGSEPATPKSTKFGTAAAVPVAAAGPPRGPPGPNNVHRVQLDFKPSMDDELELRSGQLVRMLHEYDDGWALCIRMDRSQQGVAPRTCLSKLPVKPRPQGPPPNGPRPGMAPGPRRPSNPPPPGAPMGGPMYPRPLTPTQAQAQRSPSPPQANGEPAASPTGGVPARKPVPGQAM